MQDFLQANRQELGIVVDDPEQYRLQIIYTQIDRDASNEPIFTSHRFRVDENEYFYPASTVKLPTALLALQKLNQLKVDELDRNSTMLTGVARAAQSAAVSDKTATSGLPSVGQYVRKIFLVSDNDAYNRLYEFLGQRPLNESLREKGYRDTRIMHRLELVRSIEENRHTNPVTFTQGAQVLYEQPPVYSHELFLNDEPILLGKAEVVGDRLLTRPKNFADKNSFPLQDLHDVLLATLFPANVDEKKGVFDLDADDYCFLYRAMSMYPRESGIEAYNSEAYPDGFVKFLMFGADEARIPENIRIFNKVGDAYGFLTDAAYVVDFENGVEFVLAATVFVNDNLTFNDGNYDYDTVGQPFLRALGQSIYSFELQRERAHRPKLERFHPATLAGC